MSLRNRALRALAIHLGQGDHALLQQTLLLLRESFGVRDGEIEIVDGASLGPGIHGPVAMVADLVFTTDEDGSLWVRDWLSLTREEDPWHQIHDLKELGDYLRKP
ncbi:MAG: hypothetical protein IT368_18865 [Candidatus Hydrogenedentes bacterium]|nr:hypothetical protein [Candidatus Hydrogenedentota bacterium]